MPCTKSFRKQKRNTSKRTSGGDGTADWGSKVFGSSDSQLRGTDGAIKMNIQYASQIKGGSAVLPIKMGGRRGKKGGKGVLTDIAVPAVLLYANTMTKSMGKSSKNRNYKNKSRKSRK